jgi:purine-binding chemotaxis protein CheW
VRFGKEPIKTQRRTCILIVECNQADVETVVGLSVDSVSEVVELKNSELAPAPAFGSRIRAEFIEGVATIGDHFAVLVSAEHVLSIEEMAALVEGSIEGG